MNVNDHLQSVFLSMAHGSHVLVDIKNMACITVFICTCMSSCAVQKLSRVMSYQGSNSSLGLIGIAIDPEEHGPNRELDE